MWSLPKPPCVTSRHAPFRLLCCSYPFSKFRNTSSTLILLAHLGDQCPPRIIPSHAAAFLLYCQLGLICCPFSRLFGQSKEMVTSSFIGLPPSPRLFWGRPIFAPGEAHSFPSILTGRPVICPLLRPPRRLFQFPCPPLPLDPPPEWLAFPFPANTQNRISRGTPRTFAPCPGRVGAPLALARWTTRCACFVPPRCSFFSLPRSVHRPFPHITPVDLAVSDPPSS